MGQVGKDKWEKNREIEGKIQFIQYKEGKDNEQKGALKWEKRRQTSPWTSLTGLYTVVYCTHSWCGWPSYIPNLYTYCTVAVPKESG